MNAGRHVTARDSLNVIRGAAHDARKSEAATSSGNVRAWLSGHIVRPGTDRKKIARRLRSREARSRSGEVPCVPSDRTAKILVGRASGTYDPSSKGTIMNPALIIVIGFLVVSSLATAGPLHDAAGSGDISKVDVVLGTGVDIDERNDHGETPLMLAILNGHKEVARLLLERGAALEGRNAGGFTPLHAAAYAGDAARGCS